jgi:alpha-glucosidase
MIAEVSSNWWKTGIIYQVYPRSFQDSNHDGVGDLKGIIHRLPYLAELGIDAIWLSPIFPSPMVDFGYDIADYTDVDPLFGNLANLDSLIQQAHRQRIKLILDLVPNHTSDKHHGSLKAKALAAILNATGSSGMIPLATGGLQPTGFQNLEEAAWEFDATTNQYYLHTFLSAQPDLNWRNPAVCEAIHQVMRYLASARRRWISCGCRLVYHQG